MRRKEFELQVLENQRVILECIKDQYETTYGREAYCAAKVGENLRSTNALLKHEKEAINNGNIQL